MGSWKWDRETLGVRFQSDLNEVKSLQCNDLTTQIGCQEKTPICGAFA